MESVKIVSKKRSFSGRGEGDDNASSSKQKFSSQAPAEVSDGDKNVKMGKTKKRLPKNKRREATKKASKVGKTRDFPGDLEQYVNEWTERNDGNNTWKFNKILQAWALDHCFDKKKIDSSLFKVILPYLLTIQGGALDRLVSKAASILSTNKNDIVNDDDGVAPPVPDQAEELDQNDATVGDEDDETVKKVVVITKSMVHRAKKIQKGINK
jgi:hypothetical protein